MIAGCAGPEQIELQALPAGSTQWRTLRSHTTATSLTVLSGDGLDELKPGAAHRFRLMGINRWGNSALGEASPPYLAGLPTSALRKPIVHATSSSSFDVLLPAPSVRCLEGLAWTVMVRLPPQDWQVLGTGASASTYAVERLRCPKAGCEFKLRPDVHTFTGSDSLGRFDGPSVSVRNKPLPASPPTSVRMEVRVQGAVNSLQRAQLRAQLQEWLHLPQEPAIVEAYTGAGASSTYVILDMRAATEADAQVAAQTLANDIANERLESDGAGALLRRIERNPGVQLGQPGQWQKLQPEPPRGFIAQLEEAAMQLARLLALGAAALAAAACLVGLALFAWRRRRGAAGGGMVGKYDRISKDEHASCIASRESHAGFTIGGDDDDDEVCRDDDGWPT